MLRLRPTFGAHLRHLPASLVTQVSFFVPLFRPGTLVLTVCATAALVFYAACLGTYVRLSGDARTVTVRNKFWTSTVNLELVSAVRTSSMHWSRFGPPVPLLIVADRTVDLAGCGGHTLPRLQPILDAIVAANPEVEIDDYFTQAAHKRFRHPHIG